LGCQIGNQPSFAQIQRLLHIAPDPLECGGICELLQSGALPSFQRVEDFATLAMVKSSAVGRSRRDQFNLRSVDIFAICDYRDRNAAAEISAHLRALEESSVRRADATPAPSKARIKETLDSRCRC